MGTKTGLDKVAEDLRAAMLAPEPEDWTVAYTPEAAIGYAEELQLLEAELDAGWPGWRQQQPFGDVPKEKQGWIKLRLKRRDLIVRGHGHMGVHLQWRGDRPFAVPVIPRAMRGEPFRPVVSVPMLARHLGERVDDVQEALSLVPDGERAVATWVQNHLQARRAPPTEAGSHAPPQPPAATPKPRKRASKRGAK